MKARIEINDIHTDTLGMLNTEGETIEEICDIAAMLIAHIPDMPENFDILIEVGE